MQDVNFSLAMHSVLYKNLENSICLLHERIKEGSVMYS